MGVSGHGVRGTPRGSSREPKGEKKQSPYPQYVVPKRNIIGNCRSCGKSYLIPPQNGGCSC